MKSDEIKLMINLYIDNELEKKKEPLLFTLLSQDEEAREYFFKINILKNSIEETVEEFPSELEERIFNSIKSSPKKFEKVKRAERLLTAFSIAAAGLFFIINVVLFFIIQNYSHKIEIVSEQVKNQNRTIELILDNSLPPVQIEAVILEEIIKTKM